MPTGRYTHADPHTGAPVATEEFSCAAGAAGWRYVGTVRDLDGRQTGRVDVTLDGGGRQVRVQLSGGGWLLRGGVAGRDTVWLRTPESGGPDPDGTERSESAAGFTGRSPAFLVAASRLLRLTAGGRARLRLVTVDGGSLASRVVEQGWELVGLIEHPTETGPLPVRRYRVSDLDTGEVGEVHLAGDVVLAAPALDLDDLTSPPTLA